MVSFEGQLTVTTKVDRTKMIKQDESNDGNVINISTYNEVNNEFLNDIYKIAGIKNCEFVSDNQFNATIEWINYNDMRVCNMVLPPGRLVREVAQVAGKAPCFVVVAAQNGALRLTLEQGSHDVAGERIVVFDARTLSSIDLIAGEDGRCTFQWLELSSITDFAGAMKGEAASIESVSLREYVQFFSRFLLKYGSSHISDYVDVSIRQNIVEMLKTFLRDQTARNDGGNKARLANDIIEYIKKNLDNHDLGAGRIARQFNISQRKLYKIFEESGLSLRDTILHYRLEAARKELASSTDKKIINIAFDSGFNDVSTFYRNFKRKYGYSPRSSQ